MATDSFVQLLFWLIVFHFLADFPLQGDFLSKLKNRNDPINDNETQPLGSANVWPWGLWGHGFIHGGFVFYATGNIWLGVCEIVAHAYIDWQKCEKRISFHQDQWAHIGFKVFWALITVSLAR